MAPACLCAHLLPISTTIIYPSVLLSQHRKEWHILGINTINWRMRVLAPFNELRSAPLDHILMGITGVSESQGVSKGVRKEVRRVHME